MTVTVIPGLSAIAGRYDGFLLDLWGVLYDGGTVFPHALAAMRRLREGGARLVVLSNGPRRATAVARRMADAGIPADAYDGIMSSGEEAWRSLAGERPDPWYVGIGRRCFYIGTDGDRDMLAGLDVEAVPEIGDAHFILAIGPYGGHNTLADYEALLAAAAARGVKMVCANPDLVVHRLGREELCAGALAQRYEALGGDVRWHGKPHRSLYESAVALLGPVARERIVVVGDSFRTDIRGAVGAGLDSLLVAAGIHRDDLCDAGGRPDTARIERYAAEAGAVPTWACGRFEW